MPHVLMIVPETNGVLELQLTSDETLVYADGTRLVNEDTVTFYETLPEPLPGNTTILPMPVLDMSDPDSPVVIGYNITTRSLVERPIRKGGWATVSNIPRYDVPPDGVVVRVSGTTDMLNTLDGRLQAVDAIYGIVPGEAIHDD